MAEIKPTRMELLKVKAKIRLAKSGYNLLKKKRDGLILEFFEALKSAKTLRQDLVKGFIHANDKMNLTRMLESDLKIRSVAKAIKMHPSVELEQKNVVGVIVPRIKGEKVQKKLLERGYEVYSSAAINEAAEAYEKLTERIIVVAEVETTLRRLIAEIEKTKRRVNALEFSVIPNLQRVSSIISFRLQEMERDNFTRLKLIKARLAKT
jgi:V/A-type H+-transporting ATPase subunit D